MVKPILFENFQACLICGSDGEHGDGDGGGVFVGGGGGGVFVVGGGGVVVVEVGC